MKKTSPIVLLAATLLAGLGLSVVQAKLEREQLQIETQIQQRIENILARTLPANTYLVTVKVEMDTRTRPSTVRTTTGGRRGRNPFQSESQFVLPGVPQRKDFVIQEDQQAAETTLSTQEAETLVRRILITILLSPGVTPEQIRGIRDVLQASIPFNPLRGDEMDIQTSTLLKPLAQTDGGSGRGGAAAGSAISGAAGASGVAVAGGSSGNFLSGWFNRNNVPALVLLGALGAVFLIFLAFLFGPVRTFLNRLLAVLPRVGEQAAYAVSNAPQRPAAPGTGSLNTVVANVNGGRSNGPDAQDLPFYFIREDQLSKLPILLRQMAPAQAAIVLAYLKPEWASQMLGALETGVQTAILHELSQAREVPPESVKEVESAVKAKLPYLVGGVDWIQSVYQLTQPQTQRALLGTLSQQSPELAQNLRKRTFFFEDVAFVGAGALRLLVSEAGYPVLALAIKDEKPEFRNAILSRLPAATREIIVQELELSGEDKTGIQDAKIKLTAIGRRLLAEGRIQLGERK